MTEENTSKPGAENRSNIQADSSTINFCKVWEKLLVRPRRRPFNSENEVIITIPIEFGYSFLSIFPVHKIDKTKTSTRAGLLIESNVNSTHGAKSTEQLVQVCLAGILREIGDPDRVLIVSTPHVGPSSLCTRSLAGRNIGSLAGSWSSSWDFWWRGFVNGAITLWSEILVRASWCPVVTFLATCPTHHENSTCFSDLSQGISGILCFFRFATCWQVRNQQGTIKNVAFETVLWKHQCTNKKTHIKMLQFMINHRIHKNHLIIKIKQILLVK